MKFKNFIYTAGLAALIGIYSLYPRYSQEKTNYKPNCPVNVIITDPKAPPVAINPDCITYSNKNNLENKVREPVRYTPRQSPQRQAHQRQNQQKPKKQDNYQTKQIKQIILRESREHRIDYNYVLAIAHAESTFNSRAVSEAGCVGVMQLKPSTAKLYNRNINRNDLFDPNVNIDIGVRHLKDLSIKYNGNPKLVAAAYNAGEGAVTNGRIPHNGETEYFVEKVDKYYKMYKKQNL
ncbi:MAG: lytic transglycosylase domain-containing protein [Candidatus Nanoarchaeia archaeon]|nr:lytic transglycosylase domain-containing protein [Candidatus Nanoarchaeia archaeon]